MHLSGVIRIFNFVEPTPGSVEACVLLVRSRSEEDLREFVRSKQSEEQEILIFLYRYEISIIIYYYIVIIKFLFAGMSPMQFYVHITKWELNFSGARFRRFYDLILQKRTQLHTKFLSGKNSLSHTTTELKFFLLLRRI